MLHNIHNALSDVEVLVGGNHFPIKAEYVGVVNDWHNVTFKNDQNDTLEVEVHVDDNLQSVVMGVLVQTGFTNAQRDIIMDSFKDVFRF